MSYRLINANDLALKYPEVNDMPCIYADLPKGLDGRYYGLTKRQVNDMEDYERIDKGEIYKAVVLLDRFTKTFCRYRNDYERFDDLKFRCDECPFQHDDGMCMVKEFKCKYVPDYKDLVQWEIYKAGEEE